MNLVFQKEVQEGDIHLETISKSVVFTTTELYAMS